MRFLRRLGPSFRALFAHKLRAALALTSVAAGVAAVLVTGAIGSGVRQEVLRQSEAMGTNLLAVRPEQVKTSAARKTIRGVVTTLRPADYEAIAQLPEVQEAAPGFESLQPVKAADNTMKAVVLGTTAAYIDVARFRLRLGRFLDEDDDRSAQRVAVLGARVYEALFEQGDPCGRDIRVRGIPFEVIGVLERKGVLADGSDQDNKVIIPIRTALRRVFNITWLNPIFVSVADASEMDRATAEISSLLRARHRREDFSVQNKTKALEAQRQLADSLTLLTAGLAGISLFVGGAGILGLMLMSVKERTGEIGLRMAVGARPRDILVQFLLEATLLCAGGWALGAALGAAGAAIVSSTTTWKVAVPVEAIVASLGMAAITGLGFGWYPARKASLMPPIRALLLE